MAADGTTRDPATDPIARVFSAFAREVFNPMVAMNGVAPGERRRLLDEIRRRLDLVEEVIATTEAAGTVPVYATDHASAHALNGYDNDTGGLDDIGRNQRSRVRELVLLEVLSRETKAYSLNQLMSAIAQRGFQDTQAAVVSQLHRLKKLGLIRQPENSTGMYEITNSGLGHARSLRASFGTYVPA